MKKTNEKILNTAFNCLAENGYANVSMRDIAKASGSALSQLTYYFKTKETLFLEVIDMMTAKYLNQVEELLKNDISAKEKLNALADYFVHLVDNNPNLLKLFIDFTAQAMWIPSFKEKIGSLNDKLSSIIEKEIVSKSCDKEQKDMDTHSIARLIFGAMYGASVQMILSESNESTGNILKLANSMILLQPI